jgi:peptidoglycan hydrolase-like protein with peptidoglycan-binding domain
MREIERSAWTAAAMDYRREIVGIVLTAVATLTIFVNALFLQHGPHPSPIFATRPLVKPVPPLAAPAVPSKAKPDASLQNRIQLIADIQRELTRRGFYDGPADGIWGARTDAAARDFAQAAALKMNIQASDALLRAIAASDTQAKNGPPAAPHDDPIAKLLAPSPRVTAVQRALADFGYGQVNATGIYDSATRSAIETFQRERRLPVNGEITDELVRELAAVAGRPLE